MTDGAGTLVVPVDLAALCLSPKDVGAGGVEMMPPLANFSALPQPHAVNPAPYLAAEALAAAGPFAGSAAAAGRRASALGAAARTDGGKPGTGRDDEFPAGTESLAGHPLCAAIGVGHDRDDRLDRRERRAVTGKYVQCRTGAADRAAHPTRRSDSELCLSRDEVARGRLGRAQRDAAGQFGQWAAARHQPDRLFSEPDGDRFRGGDLRRLLPKLQFRLRSL